MSAVEQEAQALDAFVEKLKGLSEEEVIRSLEGLDPAFLRDLYSRLLISAGDAAHDVHKVAVKMDDTWRPTTKDQVWRLLRDECGIAVPRNAVCPGHVAPMDFASDVILEEGNPDKLAVGNRGSGKTNIMGAAHAAKGRTQPRWTGATVGAVQQQADRCYAFFRSIVRGEVAPIDATEHEKDVLKNRWARFVAGKVLMGKTIFRGGGRVEILTGTITGVNSPHPNMAHLDEVELLRPGVYDESLNMAQSKDGHRAMNVLTSSWKKPHGLVSQLMDECEEAERIGADPPYQVYRWCVWETTERCDEDCGDCPFKNVIKGQWADGSPRTFESACKRDSPFVDDEGRTLGKLKGTDGFVAVHDAVARFRKLPRRIWEAQQESKRPTLEGLVYDIWEEDRFGLQWWEPDPAFGPVDVSIDFGGGVPHAVGFWQTTTFDIQHSGKFVPAGSDILFDEIYAENLGNAELGVLINARVDQWEQMQPGFTANVEEYWGDPAQLAGKLDMRRLNNLVPGQRAIPVRGIKPRVLEGINLVYARMDAERVWVDTMRCENWLTEQGGYEWPKDGEKVVKSRNPRKEDDHHMDQMRYKFWNRHARDRKSGDSQNMEAPVAAARERAVVVNQKTGEGHMWDPTTLGVVEKREGIGSQEAEDMITAVVAPRRRDIGM